MARSDMSDLEWNFIKQVLPNKPRGVKRVDDQAGDQRDFLRASHGHPLGRFARAIWTSYNAL